jgi:LPXTG-site transpeptidase (sortase) family protein
MKRHIRKKGKSWSYYVGNSLVIGAFISFVILFWPLFQIYLFPPVIRENLPGTGTFITIPEIHAQAPVILGVDPNNQAVYDAALKQGVAQAKGTALPGQKGTIYIFAHSSGPLWDLTHFNTIFLRLGELKKGDLIYIKRNGKTYDYRVRTSKTVSPSHVSYLTDDTSTQLILQTCTPIGTSLFRLLIFADPSK